MANKKISELNAAAALDGTEVLPLNQGGTTKRGTASALAKFIESGGLAAFLNNTFYESLISGALPEVGSPLSFTLPELTYLWADGKMQVFPAQDLVLLADAYNYLDYNRDTDDWMLVSDLQSSSETTDELPGYTRMIEFDTGATTIDDVYTYNGMPGLTIKGSPGNDGSRLSFTDPIIHIAGDHLGRYFNGFGGSVSLLCSDIRQWKRASYTGGSNISFFGSLYKLTTGSNNVGFESALGNLTTGDNNFGCGILAGGSMTTGGNNFLWGFNTGYNITTGSYNVALGTHALKNASNPTECIAIGYGALSGMTLTAGATGNIAIGRQAGGGTNNGLTGDHNVMIGTESGANMTSGTRNSLFGRQSGVGITTGDDNTFIGYGAAGTLTTGSNNTAIGSQAQPAAVNSSNSVTLGSPSIAVLRCAVTSITAISDARDKKDVVDLSFGLDFIRKLRPVEFTWDMRDGGKVGIKDSGFIAQELKTAQEEVGGKDVLQLVYEDNPEKLEASAGRLIPVLVKAIQELAAEVEELKKKVNGN